MSVRMNGTVNGVLAVILMEEDVADSEVVAYICRLKSGRMIKKRLF